MAWVRIDDQFPDHPKVLVAGPLAGWLYVCGLAYCNRLLTDGFIPAGQVRKLADVEDAPTLAAALVAAGLWEAVEGGYQVHDYLDYQPSRATVEAERQATAKRVQEWRARNGKGNTAVTPPVTADEGICNAVSNAVTNGVSNAPVTPAPTPTRSQRDLDPKEDLIPTSGANAESAPEQSPVVDNFTPWFDTLWAAYPARDGKKHEKGAAMRAARQIAARDRDRVTVAVGYFARSRQAVRGFAPDMHRFLQPRKNDVPMWQEWETPEDPTLSVIGGTNATSDKLGDKFTRIEQQIAATLADADPFSGDPGPDHRNVRLLRAGADAGRRGA